MAIQLSTTLRNNMVGQYETTIGTAPTLEIRTGAPPANCAAADTGTLLAAITLPTDWMGAASGGTVSLAGTWSGTASAAGTAGHYRIKAGATCHEQGDITATGGGGDLTLVNTNIANGQPVSVSSWTRTQGGA